MKKLNKISKTIFEGFSVKKLLFSILCSIIVSISIVATYLFIEAIPAVILCDVLDGVNYEDEYTKELLQSYEEEYKNIEEMVELSKEENGEDHPAGGLFLNALTNIKNLEIVYMYGTAILVGIILGTLIYIIFIQKTKGVQMLLETIICGLVILLILAIVNLGYNVIVNMAINDIVKINENIQYSTYVYDDSNILIKFIGIIIVAYIVNLIYQKILANKFNKKLKKNTKICN